MSQRGSLTVEFAILAPAVIVLFGVIVGGARTWAAQAAVEQIAAAGARAASLEHEAASATTAAHHLATVQASTTDVRCAPLELDVDTAVFNTPAGAPGRVAVTARCAVSLGDVLVPGWPGTVTVTATGSSIVDSYRWRK